MIWFLFVGVILIIVEILTPSIFFFLFFVIAFILNSIVYRFTNNFALLFFIILKNQIFLDKIQNIKVISLTI